MKPPQKAEEKGAPKKASALAQAKAPEAWANGNGNARRRTPKLPKRPLNAARCRSACSEDFDWVREGIRWSKHGEILDYEGMVLSHATVADTSSLFGAA